MVSAGSWETPWRPTIERCCVQGGVRWLCVIMRNTTRQSGTYKHQDTDWEGEKLGAASKQNQMWCVARLPDFLRNAVLLYLCFVLSLFLLHFALEVTNTQTHVVTQSCFDVISPGEEAVCAGGAWNVSYASWETLCETNMADRIFPGSSGWDTSRWKANMNWFVTDKRVLVWLAEGLISDFTCLNRSEDPVSPWPEGGTGCASSVFWLWSEETKLRNKSEIQTKLCETLWTLWTKTNVVKDLLRFAADLLVFLFLSGRSFVFVFQPLVVGRSLKETKIHSSIYCCYSIINPLLITDYLLSAIYCTAPYKCNITPFIALFLI